MPLGTQADQAFRHMDAALDQGTCHFLVTIVLKTAITQPYNGDDSDLARAALPQRHALSKAGGCRWNDLCPFKHAGG